MPYLREKQLIMNNWSQQVKTIFLETQKDSVIETIHTIVKEGIYGTDYTIAPRKKNKKLRERYNINDSKIKEILLSLNTNDFISQDMSIHDEHTDDIICKFIKVYSLMPKWKENADYEDVFRHIVNN